MIRLSSILWMLPALFAVGSEASAQLGTATEGEVRNIGTRRELFVDRFLIDRLVGTSLKLHEPQPVHWANDTDLSALADQPVRLRFVMQEADLFSLKFGSP